MICYDYLGLGHRLWPVEDTIRITPRGSGIGAFDTTFGNVVPNLRKLLDSGKFPLVRVHLWWANDHRICPLSVVKERAPVYEKLAKKYPHVDIYLSHSCEYSENDIAVVKERIRWLRRLAPSCTPINTCMKGASNPGVLKEAHTSGSENTHTPFVSLDGAANGKGAHGVDVKRFLNNNSGAKCFIWASRYNLRDIGETPPPPLDRTKPPSKEYLKEVVAMTR